MSCAGDFSVEHRNNFRVKDLLVKIAAVVEVVVAIANDKGFDDASGGNVDTYSFSSSWVAATVQQYTAVQEQWKFKE